MSRDEVAVSAAGGVSPTALEGRRLRVGVTLWLASELMFFAGLFAAYFTLRAASTAWPPAGAHLDALRAGLFTLILVASSGTVAAAERAFEAGARRRFAWLLGSSIVLGAVFLANQLLEYRGVGFTISSHPYGSIYFLMTGFHGLHVLGGLVLMAVVAARVGLAPGRRDRVLVTVTSYYWHFVDVVWIALYATIFLLR